MGGRDINESGVGPAPPSPLQVEAFSIYGDAADLSADRPEHDGGAGVAGIFRPNRIARIQQEVGRAFQGFLHARNNQHLLRRALHSSGSVQVGGNRLAQGEISQGLAAGQQLGRGAPQAATDYLSPQRSGKSVERRLIGAEGAGDARLAASKRRQAAGVGRPVHAAAAG